MHIPPHDAALPLPDVSGTAPQPRHKQARVLRASSLDAVAAPRSAGVGAVLAALLTQLDRGVSLVTRYRIAGAPEAPVALELSLHDPADAGVAASHFRTLAGWARLAAPELRFVVAAPQCDLACGWRREIRPQPATIPGQDAAASQPLRPHPLAAIGQGVAIALPKIVGGAPNGLDACLDILTHRNRAAELELALAPVLLDAAQLRTLDTAIVALRAGLHRSEANGPKAAGEIMRTLEAATEFRQAGHGVHAALRLALIGHPDQALADLLSRLYYGAPAAEVAPPDTLDLAACWPPSAPPPEPLPTPPTRLRLGIGAAQAPGALHLPKRRILLGATPQGEPVRLSPRDQARHAYIIGATGVGKSTLLAAMIRQDIAAGHGVILFDPHGDLFQEIRHGLPRGIAARTTIADVADTASPFGLNILDCGDGDVAVERNQVCSQLVDLFQRTLYAAVPEGFGPMFDAYFRNALMLLMEAGGPEATLADFDRVFADAAYRKRLINDSRDSQVRRFWSGIAEQVTNPEHNINSIAPYIVSKLTRFTGNPLIRPIITRPTTIDLTGCMERGDVCLINLAKGVAGRADTVLLGGLILTRLFAAVLRRAAQPPAARRVVRLYLDEFQSYATDTLADLLAESRKFGLECVLANQSLTQIDGPGAGSTVAHAVLTNVGTVVAFRVGPEDAGRLARWFEPEIGKTELMRLADHQAAIRLLADGRPQPAFRFHTLGPRGSG